MPPYSMESLERNGSTCGIDLAGERCQSRYRDLARPRCTLLRHADAHGCHHHGRSRQASRHGQLHALSGCLGKRRGLCGNFSGSLDDHAQRSLEICWKMPRSCGRQAVDAGMFRPQRTALEIYTARKFSECRWRMSHGKRPGQSIATPEHTDLRTQSVGPNLVTAQLNWNKRNEARIIRAMRAPRNVSQTNQARFSFIRRSSSGTAMVAVVQYVESLLLPLACCMHLNSEV